MSAKDPRRSALVALSPEGRARLAHLSKRWGGVGLAAAARRLLRAELGLGAPPPTPLAHWPRGRARGAPMRLQLEPALRHALGAPDAATLSHRLETALARWAGA